MYLSKYSCNFLFLVFLISFTANCNRVRDFIDSKQGVNKNVELQVGTQSLTFFGNKETYLFSFISKQKWNITFKNNPSWLHVNTISGSGSSQNIYVNISVDANLSEEKRQTTLTLISGKFKVEVPVEQKTLAPSLEIASQLSYVLNYKEVVQDIYFTSNREWQASVTQGASWVFINADTRSGSPNLNKSFAAGSNTARVTFSVLPNPTNNVRVAQITITSSTVTKHITIAQNGHDLPANNVLSTPVNQTPTPVVSTPVNQTPTPVIPYPYNNPFNPPWVFTPPVYSPQLPLACSTLLPLSHSVFAQTPLTFDLETTLLSELSSGNTVSVHSNSSWQASILSGKEWVKINENSSFENRSCSKTTVALKYSVTDNTSAQDRSAIIIIANVSQSKAVLIKQKGSILTVDDELIKPLSHTRVMKVIAVTSNRLWFPKVTSGSDWLSVTTMGSDHASLTTKSVPVVLRFSENTTSEIRKATVEIVSGNLKKILNVQQLPKIPSAILQPTPFSVIRFDNSQVKVTEDYHIQSLLPVNCSNSESSQPTPTTLGCSIEINASWLTASVSSPNSYANVTIPKSVRNAEIYPVVGLFRIFYKSPEYLVSYKRQATIKLKITNYIGETNEYTVEFHQEPEYTDKRTLSTFPESLSTESESNSMIVEVDANAGWTATLQPITENVPSNYNWEKIQEAIHLSTTESKYIKGKEQIVITFDRNYTQYTRLANLVITVDKGMGDLVDIVKKIPLTQYGLGGANSPFLKIIGNNNINIDKHANIEFLTNTVTDIATEDSWLHVLSNSMEPLIENTEYKTRFVGISADTNLTGVVRRGFVSLSQNRLGGQSQRVEITQLPYILELNQSTFTFDLATFTNDNNQKNLCIKSQDNYTIQINDNWLDISSRYGNVASLNSCREHTITVGDNLTGVDRTATISVSTAAGVIKTFTVVQPTRKHIVETNTGFAGSSNRNYQFMMNWTANIVKGDTWLAINNTSGTSSTELVVTLNTDLYAGPQSRDGEVEVVFDNNMIVVFKYVQQNLD